MGLQRNAEGRGEIIKLSQTLYELIGKIPKKEELAEKIVEDIISRDEYGDASKSSYLLKEIMGVGVMVKKAVSEASTEKIFNYIMALLEVFPEESQLEIPRFICEFFSMRFKDSAQVDLSVLGAGDKQSSCRPQQAYRCLKCADKKLFCSGCATVCHK